MRELQQSGRNGKWTIGFIGRSKRAREAAIQEALMPGELPVATFEKMDVTRGRGARSGLRFGDRCVGLVTRDRLVIIAANFGPRITVNPLVLVVSFLVHGLVPVRMPYLLLEARLGDVDVEVKGGIGGRYVSLRVPGSEWVLRFEQEYEPGEFARLVRGKS